MDNYADAQGLFSIIYMEKSRKAFILLIAFFVSAVSGGVALQNSHSPFWYSRHKAL